MRRNKNDGNLVVVKDNTSDKIEKATGVLTAVSILVGIVVEIVGIANSGKND